MAKIKWKNKSGINAEKALSEQLKSEREKYKGKLFKNLSTGEKDALLEILLKEHGLI